MPYRNDMSHHACPAPAQDQLRGLLDTLEMLARERRAPEYAVPVFEQIFDLQREASRLEEENVA